ncbi:MAG TPA: hypothetical protein VFK68_04635 [Propionibacteriaceae bacterium]|nr:hypothetical protein [Propionibacteriaceae bacterium]
MIDRIKALREHATVVAVLVVLVGIAVTTGRIATDLRTFPLPQVLRGVSGLYGLVDALVLTVLALSCVLVSPRTRHAEQLTLAAAILLWLGAVVGLVFLVISLVGAGEGSLSRILESIGGLTDIALRALMGYALVLGRRVAMAPADEVRAAEPAAPATGTEVEPAQEVTGEISGRPAWHADEAAGVVWRSAADAASGAPAGTYGSASPRSGPPVWDPSGDVTRKDADAGRDRTTNPD